MFNNATSPLTLQWSQQRNPANYVQSNSGQLSSGVSVPAPAQNNNQIQAIDNTPVIDPAAQAAAAAAAAQAAKASQLRGQVTAIANTIKDIFNSRYGQVDNSAKEQTGQLNNRFSNESQDLTNQIGGEVEKLGAAHAASGTYDSSYRGNNVDTVTNAGESQIRDLGTELNDNLAKVGQWATQQKAGFDANKGGVDQILSHLAEESDPSNLSQIRSALETRLADLNAASADNNSASQNVAALDAIAPAGARAQQLKSTLSQVVAGSAPAGKKLEIGQKLISSANLTPDDQQKLLSALQTDLASPDQQKQQAQ